MKKGQAFDPHNMTVALLLKKGEFIKNMLQQIRQHIISNPPYVELSQVTYVFRGRAAKFGGIELILQELEALGEIKIEQNMRFKRLIYIPELNLKDDEDQVS